MTCSCTTTQSEPDIYVPTPARLLNTKPMTELERHYEIQLDSGEPLGHQPGQFVEVSLAGIGEAPISISSSPDTSPAFELVVRNVGRLTSAMHELPAETPIGIRGPFGQPFPVEEDMKGKDILFIAGGIGLVPLRSAIQYVLNHRENYGNVTILNGAKTPGERLFADEMGQWANRNDVTFMETVDKADAQWQGNVGVITTLIPKVDLDAENTVAVVCGPPVMYKFVLVELFSRNIAGENIFVSLERRMKCGVGKCGHCQINNYYTCIDGPVFRYSDLSDVPEAI